MHFGSRDLELTSTPAHVCARTCAACDVCWCVDPTIDLANVAVGDLDKADAPVPRPPPLAARSGDE